MSRPLDPRDIPPEPDIDEARAAIAASLAALKDAEPTLTDEAGNVVDLGLPTKDAPMTDPKPDPKATDPTEAELVDDTDEQRSPTDDRQEHGETGGAGTIEGRSPEQGSEDPA